MHDKLKEFVQETQVELLKGMSAQELVRALSPETLEALARLLKANGRPAEPDAKPTDRPREKDSGK
jgi:hypothetical protein